MSSNAPGTLFRLTTADGSKHCTAVVCKNGSLYEVKNEISAVRERFETLEAWQQARGADLVLTTDTSKAGATGPLIQIGNTHGFHYPDERVSAFYWLKWVYSMLVEAAPQLLENETLKAAYNKMVAVTTENKDRINTYYYRICRYSSSSRYNKDNLRLTPNSYNGWNGYYCGFVLEYRFSTSETNKIRKEIAEQYRIIVEIVSPAVQEYMSSRYESHIKKYYISKIKRRVKHLERKQMKIAKELEDTKKKLDEEVAEMAKLEAAR
jgi:hypothetical protein